MGAEQQGLIPTEADEAPKKPGKVMRAMHFAVLAKTKAAALAARKAAKNAGTLPKAQKDELRAALANAASAHNKLIDAQDSEKPDENSVVFRFLRIGSLEPDSAYIKAIAELCSCASRCHLALGRPYLDFADQADSIGAASAAAETSKKNALSKDGKTLFSADREIAMRFFKTPEGAKLRIASDSGRDHSEDELQADSLLGLTFLTSESDHFSEILALLSDAKNKPPYERSLSHFMSGSFIPMAALSEISNLIDDNPIAAIACLCSHLAEVLKHKPHEKTAETPHGKEVALHSKGWDAAAQAVEIARREHLQGALQRMTKDFLANSLPAAASSCISRVWSDPRSIPLREFERFANFHELASGMLEQNENLAIFALRAARGLGLDEMGENLFGETKARLAEHGLSAGGWKLLSRLPPQASEPMLARLSADSLRRAESSESLHMMFQTNLLLRAERGQTNHADPAAEKAERARLLKEAALRSAEAYRKNDLDDLTVFCLGASACAKTGLSPEQSAAFLEGLAGRPARELFASGESFFTGEDSRRDDYLGREPEARAAEAAAKDACCARLIEEYAAASRKLGLEKAQADFSEIYDFLRKSEWGVFTRLGERPSWADFKAESRKWHEMIEEQEADGRAQISWDAPLPSHQDPARGLDAVALRNGQELYEEGKAMHHCVSGYWQECRAGTSAIYSVRQDGRRIATLELQRGEDGQWTNAQFLGRFNKPVRNADAHKFADEIAKLHTAAFLRGLGARQDAPDAQAPDQSGPKFRP